MTELEYDSLRRLWQMFFRDTFDEKHGVSPVADLLKQHRAATARRNGEIPNTKSKPV